MGRRKIIKMTMLSKAIYKFSVIPIEVLKAFFTQLEQKFRNLYETTKQAAKTLLRKNKAEGIILPDFKLYYKTIVIKRV